MNPTAAARMVLSRFGEIMLLAIVFRRAFSFEINCATFSDAWMLRLFVPSVFTFAPGTASEAFDSPGEDAERRAAAESMVVVGRGTRKVHGPERGTRGSTLRARQAAEGAARRALSELCPKSCGPFENRFSPKKPLSIILLRFFLCPQMLEELRRKAASKQEALNAIQEVLPGVLCISNMAAARDRGKLAARNITHVLTAGVGMPPPFPAALTYLVLDVLDEERVDLSLHFRRALAFIDEARAGGGVVLVHCEGGVSRSATLATAYVMHARALHSATEALAVVRRARSFVRPNAAFMRQLERYAGQLRVRAASRADAVPTLRMQIASDLHLEFGAAEAEAAAGAAAKAAAGAAAGTAAGAVGGRDGGEQVMRLVAQAKQQGMFSDEALGAVVPVAEPRAPVLGLLGDIGDPFTEVYRRFLEIQATRFDLVLVLSGNHEYYNTFDLTAGGSNGGGYAKAPAPWRTVAEVQAQIRSVCDNGPPNLVYFDQGSRMIEGVRVIGTPLWSYIPPSAQGVVEQTVLDYRRIAVADGGQAGGGGARALTAAESTAWHQREVEWVEEQIRASMLAGEPAAVVLTHHTPSFQGTSDPRHGLPMHNKVNYAFSSNLEHLFAEFGQEVGREAGREAGKRGGADGGRGGREGGGEEKHGDGGGDSGKDGSGAGDCTSDEEAEGHGNSHIAAWCFGHTHYSCDLELHGTRLVSHQRGYQYPTALAGKAGDGGGSGAESDAVRRYKAGLILEVPARPPRAAARRRRAEVESPG